MYRGVHEYCVGIVTVHSGFGNGVCGNCVLYRGTFSNGARVQVVAIVMVMVAIVMVVVAIVMVPVCRWLW